MSGIVTGKDGLPQDRVRVTAMAVPSAGVNDPETAVLVTLAQTDSRGHFVLENVPPGRYYITAGLVRAPIHYPGVTTRANAAIIELRSGANLVGIDFSAAQALSIGGRVSGQVVLANLPGVQTVILSGQSAVSGNLSFQTAVHADGSFSFPLIPTGSYVLRAPGAGNVLSFLNNVPIDVGYKDISDIQIGSELSIIIGRIVTSDGSPLPPLPREADLQTLAATAQWSSGIASTSIRAGGMFELHRPSGEFKVGVSNLPLGYTIQSISYGGRDLVSGLFKIDGPITSELRITLAVTPNQSTKTLFNLYVCD